MNTKLIQNIVNLYSTPKIIFLGISFKITERKSGTHYMVVTQSSVKHMKLAKNVGMSDRCCCCLPPSILILWASQGREGTYNIFSCTLHNIINGRDYSEQKYIQHIWNCCIIIIIIIIIIINIFNKYMYFTSFTSQKICEEI